MKLLNTLKLIPLRKKPEQHKYKETANRVIYEDDEIKVMYQPGRGDNLIITFGDLMSLAKENRFFADTPLKKLNFSTIGFVAKRPNWYPEKSMKEAAGRALHLLKLYPKNILYGGSMGGYAALKYSRLLNADITLSLCPQWSIDPIECNNFKTGYEKHFNSSMNGMGIIPSDLKGKIFVFFDPHHEKDSFHANKISTLSEDFTAIHVPYSGHHVTTVLAGTKHLHNLIEAANNHDEIGLRFASSRARRTSDKRAQILLEKLSIRHPTLAEKILKSNQTLKKIDTNTLQKIEINILSNISTDNHPDLAESMIRRVILSNKCPVREKLLIDWHRTINITRRGFSSQRIITHHRTFIYYDLSIGKLVNLQPGSINFSSTRFFEATAIGADNNSLHLGVTINNEPYALSSDKHGNIYLTHIFSLKKESKDFITVTPTQEATHIVFRNTYISAQKDGTMGFYKKRAGNWESFKLSSD